MAGPGHWDECGQWSSSRGSGLRRSFDHSYGQVVRGGVSDWRRVLSRALFRVFAVAVLLLSGPVNAAKSDGYVPSADQYNIEGAFGGFILDRVSNPPRMKYEWSSEIFVLRETPGPRGGTYYKLDTGQNVLAETTSGSFILFTKKYPRGVPATWIGSVDKLRRPYLSVSDAFAQVYRIEERLNERMRRDIRFIIDWDKMSSDAQYRIGATDVAQISGRALLDLADDPELLKLIRKKIKKIRVVEGAAPGVAVDGSSVVVRFHGKGGVLGRYSSQRTALALKQKL